MIWAGQLVAGKLGEINLARMPALLLLIVQMEKESGLHACSSHLGSKPSWLGCRKELAHTLLVRRFQRVQ